MGSVFDGHAACMLEVADDCAEGVYEGFTVLVVLQVFLEPARLYDFLHSLSTYSSKCSMS